MSRTVKYPTDTSCEDRAWSMRRICRTGEHPGWVEANVSGGSLRELWLAGRRSILV